MKEFAAKALAAYSGYASTRKVKMPVKTRRVLHESQPVRCFSKVLPVSVPHEMRVMRDIHRVHRQPLVRKRMHIQHHISQTRSAIDKNRWTRSTNMQERSTRAPLRATSAMERTRFGDLTGETPNLLTRHTSFLCIILRSRSCKRRKISDHLPHSENP